MMKPVFLFLIVATVGSAFSTAVSAAQFPQGFRWCVATAAHQIEGGNKESDWWAWEMQQGHVKNGEVSGAACDHWNRVEEDVALMRDLHLTDYRMSLEWARIEPQEGTFDEAAIAHYRFEIDSLKRSGIRPILTLQHFTFPKWVREKGGFEWAGLPDAFAKYTEVVYRDVAPGVADWVTINEPLVSVVAGYVAGNHPPSEKRELNKILPVIRGIALAHARAYHVLHDLAANHGFSIRVGMAHHLRTMDPQNGWNPLDHVAASIADQVWNWDLPDALETGRLKIQALWILNYDEAIPGLAGTQDFVGINYYSGDLVSYSLEHGIQQKPRQAPTKSDLGWPIYPEGFYRLLKEASRRYPGKSILITENGIADATDRLRPQFIRDHLEAVARAISEGVPVEGYCHWSLMDNFEWQEGFTPRFGLYEMDYKNMARKPRRSASVFSEIAERNGF